MHSNRNAAGVMSQSGTFVLAVILLLAFPAGVHANVGTPLIMLGVFHLLFGNAVIGLIEGGLIAGIFKVRAPRAVGIMIIANYVSAWSGYALLPELAHSQFDVELENGRTMLWSLIVAAYVLTLVIEWPFVLFCVAEKEDRLERSVKASLVIQTASNAAIFGLLCSVSHMTLYSENTVVPLSDISLPGNALVYYVSDPDGDVATYDPETGVTSTVMERNATERFSTISIAIEVVFGLESLPIGTGDIVVRGTNLMGTRTLRVIKVESERLPRYRTGANRGHGSAGLYNGDAQVLGEAKNSPWQFSAAYWPNGGLSGTNATSAQSVSVVFETPIFSWAVRNPVILPNNTVLFQLGDRQVCVFDPDTRKIALLAHGHGPIAILKPDPVAK
jgi:hypothetical protein